MASTTLVIFVITLSASIFIPPLILYLLLRRASRLYPGDSHWSPGDSFWMSMIFLVVWSRFVWYGVADEPCNMGHINIEYSNVLKRLSDLEEICRNIENPGRLEACTQSPTPTKPDDISCVGVLSAAEELNLWVDSRYSELYHACSQQDTCIRWAETAKDWDGTPILH